MRDHGGARLIDIDCELRSKERGLDPARRTVWSLTSDQTGELVRGGALVLAQFDDVVCWGQMRDGGLEWETALPGERDAGHAVEALLDLRAFASDWELHVWRAGAGFDLRLLVDRAGPGARRLRALDEYQYLWGLSLAGVANGWLDLREGSRGIRQRVPRPASGRFEPPLRLGVRSYLGYDEQGVAGVVDWRLTGLFGADEEWEPAGVATGGEV